MRWRRPDLEVRRRGGGEVRGWRCKEQEEGQRSRALARSGGGAGEEAWPELGRVEDEARWWRRKKVQAGVDLGRWLIGQAYDARIFGPIFHGTNELKLPINSQVEYFQPKNNINN